MEGLIIKNISNDYTVLSSSKLYLCKARGKIRNRNQVPLVGDHVRFNEEKKIIEEIVPRKNSFVRPPIANIDSTFLITSVKNPDFSSNLLDKQLVIMEYNRIKPIICFTKLDLLEETEKKEIEKIKQYYEKIGYTVYYNTQLDAIRASLMHKISVFTGQSGAGKSTLLNKLEPSFSLKTNDISYALGRGKHTTRHVELYPIQDGWVADTPGFSSIQFVHFEMDRFAIRDNFIEFENYKENCKYRDCMHLKEEDCAVKKEVGKSILESRYENYVKFIEERKG